ncbi:MAG: TetR/AcrR family transcriptional regulator [Cyclobacteriaceae bacterium]|jgi:AcrR family transcriptional regulator
MAKKGTALKNKIIETAHLFFSEKGYDKTSVNDIINKLGISKGAFYHYFNSKDEVLDAIILGYTAEAVDMMYDIVYNPKLNGLEKYIKMFKETQARREKNAERFSFLIQLFLKEDNLLFRHRYTEKILELTKPPFILILQQGVKEGLFIINHPEETAELIIRLGNIYRTKIAILNFTLNDNPNNLLKIQSILEFMQDTVERLLGVDSGTLNIISHSFQSGIK